MRLARPALLVTTLALGGAVLAPARAAPSYDACTGFIDALPATVGAQGTWCLRHDLSTAMASGAAISVQANNVTIDCNGFKLGGLAAGAGSFAIGVAATARQNVTVRGCGIRGFYRGVQLQGGSGHLVEDNRFDNNPYVGIWMAGGGLVQRNRLHDTGGHTSSWHSYAVVSGGDLIDNVIEGVFATPDPDGTSHATGIQMIGNEGAVIRGNRIRGLVATGFGYVVGIHSSSTATRVEDNHLASAAPASSPQDTGILYGHTCRGNSVYNFTRTIENCTHLEGNTPP